MAKRISVEVGDSETMRLGASSMVIVPSAVSMLAGNGAVSSAPGSLPSSAAPLFTGLVGGALFTGLGPSVLGRSVVSGVLYRAGVVGLGLVVDAPQATATSRIETTRADSQAIRLAPRRPSAGKAGRDESCMLLPPSCSELVAGGVPTRFPCSEDLRSFRRRQATWLRAPATGTITVAAQRRIPTGLRCSTRAGFARLGPSAGPRDTIEPPEARPTGRENGARRRGACDERRARGASTRDRTVEGCMSARPQAVVAQCRRTGSDGSDPALLVRRCARPGRSREISKKFRRWPTERPSTAEPVSRAAGRRLARCTSCRSRRSCSTCRSGSRSSRPWPYRFAPRRGRPGRHRPGGRLG